MASATILPALSAPFEFIDLPHGNSITLQVVAFEDGSGLIHPPNPSPKQVRIYMDQNGMTEPPTSGMPIGINVPVLRLFGARLDKASPSPYWDVSALTLQAQLLPLLDISSGSTPTTALEARKAVQPYGKVPLLAPITIKLTANGAKPQKRYSVEVL
jgi:hypothetical protein